MSTSKITMDAILSLSKRRGFVFQSSEIYGGLNGCWDYGPLGVELLRNIKEAWWKSMTYRDDIEGIDASILMHPRTWEASGHLSQFSDPMIDNKTSKSRYRADTLIEEYITKLRNKNKTIKADEVEQRLAKVSSNEDYYSIIVDEGITDPVSGSTEWTEVRNFNLMFKTYLGPTEDSNAVVYLRPETAQGIFVNFKNVLDTSRQKIPFGIAQIGKSFRNEINTKNFLFRTREFEQMEMQYFVKPGTHKDAYDEWVQIRRDWYKRLGMKDESLRFKNHEKLAHYADAAVDIEFLFPFGWGEIEGIHSRTDFDLMKHQEFSGKKLEFVDTVTKDRFVPYVVETAAGASRNFMAFLCNAYDEEAVADEKGGEEIRTVLRFSPELAPVTAAVFPLINNENLLDISTKLYKSLQQSMKVQFDKSGAIGRRYRRQDEIGTPFCITVDFETIDDQCVTIRERDSMAQERVSLDKVRSYIQSKM